MIAGKFIVTKRARRGQSLVEFVLAMPILVLLLAAAGSLAIGMYQAHMASDAVREPALRKLEMSNQVGAISPGMLMGYMNGGALRGTIQDGNKIDGVQTVDSDAFTTIVVGVKQFNPMIPILPSFQVRVGQAINRNLLLEASNGSPETRPYRQPWIPGNVPVIPPWEGG